MVVLCGSLQMTARAWRRVGASSRSVTWWSIVGSHAGLCRCARAAAARPAHRPAASPTAPPIIRSLQVVQTPTVLGLQVASGTQQAQTDWQLRLQLVEQCCTKRAVIGQSAFGCGISSAANGVSTLLYQAEFAGMPPPAALQNLSSITFKLTNCGLARASTARHFVGLPG